MSHHATSIFWAVSRLPGPDQAGNRRDMPGFAALGGVTDTQNTRIHESTSTTLAGRW